MLDLDVYMDGKTPLGQTAPALNIVHGNAGSLFRGAVTDTLLDAMGRNSPESPAAPHPARYPPVCACRETQHLVFHGHFYGTCHKIYFYLVGFSS